MLKANGSADQTSIAVFHTQSLLDGKSSSECRCFSFMLPIIG
jgi:hypothetical protein